MVDAKLLDTLDRVRALLNGDTSDTHISTSSDEAYDNIALLHSEICQALVDGGRYKFEDLFLTQEELDRRIDEAKELEKYLD